MFCKYIPNSNQKNDEIRWYKFEAFKDIKLFILKINIFTFSLLVSYSYISIFFLKKWNISSYFHFFQFQDVDYFMWADRQGVEHSLVPTNSSCDLKNPAWESNQGEVNDINQLPITNIKYGPMGFELAKVKIVVGPIVCQPSKNALLIRDQIVAGQIEELEDFDRVIENKTENLKTKVNENFEIVTNQTEELKNFDSVIKDENENLKTNIIKNFEIVKNMSSNVENVVNGIDVSLILVFERQL